MSRFNIFEYLEYLFFLPLTQTKQGFSWIDAFTDMNIVGEISFIFSSSDDSPSGVSQKKPNNNPPKAA